MFQKEDLAVLVWAFIAAMVVLMGLLIDWNNNRQDVRELKDKVNMYETQIEYILQNEDNYKTFVEQHKYIQEYNKLFKQREKKE